MSKNSNQNPDHSFMVYLKDNVTSWKIKGNTLGDRILEIYRNKRLVRKKIKKPNLKPK